ncbi:MAG: hypothetical protein HKN30_00515, partial [Sulfitobacter sp.]|nr:hypothetical protein [Sulfitobacter sp.]
FGDEIPRESRAQGAFSTKTGFAGTHRIGQTPLHLMGHRVYDTQTASFVSPDPLGGGTDAGLYGYAHANPHRFSDPMGLNSGLEDGLDTQPDSPAPQRRNRQPVRAMPLRPAVRAPRMIWCARLTLHHQPGPDVPPGKQGRTAHSGRRGRPSRRRRTRVPSSTATWMRSCT